MMRNNDSKEILLYNAHNNINSVVGNSLNIYNSIIQFTKLVCQNLFDFYFI